MREAGGMRRKGDRQLSSLLGQVSAAPREQFSGGAVTGLHKAVTAAAGIVTSCLSRLFLSSDGVLNTRRLRKTHSLYARRSWVSGTEL